MSEDAAMLQSALLLFVSMSFVDGVDPVLVAREHVAAHGPRILREYADLLRLPHVSTDLPNIERNAAHIVEMFARRGVDLDVVHLDDGPRCPPVIVGRLDAPGARRTLGVYVHYDGQPVDAAQWTFGPFEPALCTRALSDGGERIALPKDGEPIDPDWRLYARGSGDDKAPLPALVEAIAALDAAGIARTSNVVFLFEGEEEIGSPHLDRYLRQLRDRLAADAWLICDGPVHQSRRPQLVYGAVRGITSVELTVYGSTRYLHSGHYGNYAPNPGSRLAALLASMKGADDEILIDGFFDDVEPVEGLERALATFPDFEDELRAELGLRTSEGDNAPYLERILRPSFNVRGLASATVGDTARNVIPATATRRHRHPAAQGMRAVAHARSRRGARPVARLPHRARRARPRDAARP